MILDQHVQKLSSAFLQLDKSGDRLEEEHLEVSNTEDFRWAAGYISALTSTIEAPMENTWRSLNSNEIEIINRLISISGDEINYDLEKYRCKTIDDYGSISLRNDAELTGNEHMSILCSGLFNDGDHQDGNGPHVNIILFHQKGSLRELQIYKEDSQIIKKDIVADQIYRDDQIV